MPSYIQDKISVSEFLVAAFQPLFPYIVMAEIHGAKILFATVHWLENLAKSTTTTIKDSLTVDLAYIYT